MKKKFKNTVNHFILLLSLVSFFQAKSQEGFALPEGTKKLSLPFELVNNLIVLPVEVNNVSLSFILDTGVKSSILFSATQDTLALKNAQKVMIRGLGVNDTIEALKSRYNTFKIGSIIDKQHSLFAILDKQWDISNVMGVPIHGIIGFEVFSKFVVKINYVSKKITFYDPEFYQYKLGKKWLTTPLQLIRSKPYIKNVFLDASKKPSLFLIDSGSSDALWLFKGSNLIKESPKNYFNDYLGFGIGGKIYGKRTKISQFSLGDFNLKNINVSIPSFTDVKLLRFTKGRNGSIGGDLLSRFHLVIDYPNSKISFKKNRNINKPFNYNMSGLVLQQDGVEMVKELAPSKTYVYGIEQKAASVKNIPITLKYTFKLSPKIKIVEVQKESPAAKVDIRKGDEIIKVNGKMAYEYKLYQIIALFSSKANKNMYLTIKRGNKTFRKKFKLKPLL